MAVTREWEAFVLEQLAALGRVRSRRMFGGVGLYLDETFFGLIVGGAGDVYLKVDDDNRAAYEAAGSGPFRPFTDKPYAMSFWRVPPEVLDDPDEMTDWARAAVGAARRTAAAKKKSAPAKASRAAAAATRERSPGATKTPRQARSATRRTRRTPAPKRG
ncbi:TfoX/Sxy family protein [Candidatus Binatia bacterium]|jgi:DNA transformation protein|nr:TfoX/Sxy family protein [Candidatus Binatia bacterium]